jgi:SMI1 / KNR4 family (SUKH-1)
MENPYGPISLPDLAAFESELGCPLPQEYRDYLIAFNGGALEKDVIRISDAEGETRIHHMYGLHTGPAHQRLTSQYEGELGILQGAYLPICDDAFGNKFLIKLKGSKRGSVYFLNHEVAVSRRALTYVAESFSRFMEKMQSSEDSMEEFKARDPAGYDEFQRRLEEMRRLREDELKNKK